MGERNFGRILARSQMFGDRLAVRDLGCGYSATWSEHLDRVGHVCAALRAIGVRSDDRVAVLADSSYLYVELWRACLAGAGVITPLNTRLAPDELAYILGDAAPEVVLVDSAFAPVVAGIRDRLLHPTKVVLIGEGDGPCDQRLDDVLASTPACTLPPEPSDDAPAALIYTGGTTGQAKGVVLSQQAITMTLYRTQMAAGYRPESQYLSFLPLFHIAGIAAWGLLAPSGGATILLPAFEPGAVLRAIREHGITFIGAVPTMLAMLLTHPDYTPTSLETLELVLYGAAPMPPGLLDQLLGQYPNLSFVQTYGMTESAAVVSALLPGDHHRGGAVLRSVGRPAIGVDLDIRTPEGAEPVASGDVGEIWIRSDSLMTEYRNKPQQTADSLIDGWYRTGDAGRLDDEGFLFIADRVKDMIITGGENVYSLEVENAIGSHAAVQAVAVIGLPDAVWGERVHAVIVCEPDSVTEEQLAAHARDAIAGFKVPRTWTLQADPLPLSAAGKVLKGQLRQEIGALA